MSGEQTRRTPVMTDKERDHILKLLETGLEPNEIGEMFERSGSIVRQIKRVYEAVKAGDVEGARASAMTSKNVSLFEWACRRNGIDPNQKPETSPQEPQPPDKKPALEGDAELLFDAILAHTNKMELRMEDLMKKLDQLAVIIQSCAAGTKDAINRNADIINREQVKHTETLNGIKVNTKSRYGNQIR